VQKKNLLAWSFVNAVGTLAYIALVAAIIQNGERIFGQMKNIFGPIMFLLLFVFSAAITGALVLGRPVWLYMEGQKKDSLAVFFYTLGWMFVFLLAALGMNFAMR
jgi:hypothetical protein